MFARRFNFPVGFSRRNLKRCDEWISSKTMANKKANSRAIKILKVDWWQGIEGRL